MLDDLNLTKRLLTNIYFHEIAPNLFAHLQILFKKIMAGHVNDLLFIFDSCNPLTVTTISSCINAIFAIILLF